MRDRTVLSHAQLAYTKRVSWSGCSITHAS